MALISIDPVGRAERIRREIKAETSRRINLILKDQITQINMTAYGTALTRAESKKTISTEQMQHLDLLNAAQNWVVAMQAKGRELQVAVDESFAEDQHWPQPPAGLVELIKAL